ncbi:WD40-repeat-containing domain protein [Pisolithus marmoratus]|nr:WD40-repeat-containing domain protein [Pisolithus marmoratus]
MASGPESKSAGHRNEPVHTADRHSSSAAAQSHLAFMSKTLLAPLAHKKADSARILSDRELVIMTPRMMNAAATVTSRSRGGINSVLNGSSRMDFATLGRAPMRLTLGARRVTSRDLQIIEAKDELLGAEVPEPEGIASDVSLLRGFNATIPSSDRSRSRRRQVRNVDTRKVGLRQGLLTRGMPDEGEQGEDMRSVTSEDGAPVAGAGKRKGKRRPRESLSTTKLLGKDELSRQAQEIIRDKENLHVRRSLITNEIAEVDSKIMALSEIRCQLERDLLKTQEDELELDDELEGIQERMEFEEVSSKQQKATSVRAPHVAPSRRRKGPVFLPSEHDELPLAVAFMTLESHISPITALDFSEPYGVLVSSSQDDIQPRVWDLMTGAEIGRLQGHRGTVKCIQVEDNLCLTGSDDGSARLWNLGAVDDGWEEASLSDVAEDIGDQDGELVEKPNSVRCSAEGGGPCLRRLEGHSKAVTALYFEDDCLVTGASDKTLRQWDLTTGQCVLTMDILWAISHSPGGAAGSLSPAPLYPGLSAAGMYQDFVGAVQFWGYALVSGSGDGAVRMWDMRTGQAHRTLTGHTGPVTCLQFDETHIATGSLDKSIRIWDVRTGSTFETIKYDHGVTCLQFDSRKVVAATGENGIKIYNRTTMQHSTLATNGHTRPVQRLRYMDRYLVSGGRDATVKVWTL